MNNDPAGRGMMDMIIIFMALSWVSIQTHLNIMVLLSDPALCAITSTEEDQHSRGVLFP
jgi:hypothetical protein